MPGLLYYLPELETIGDPAQVGLGYAFEADCTCRRVMANGPDGGPGVVAVDIQRQPKPGYFADQQTWLKIPGNPAGAWVGRYTDPPPEPKDLARDEQLSGHLVRLADAQKWLVPVARACGETSDGQPVLYQAVPTRMALDEEGAWTDGEVIPRFQPLWEIALAWWDRLMAIGAAEDGSEPEETFDFDRRADAAIEVLAVNYRLARAEVALLGLFDGETARSVLDATVDMPSINAWIKKNKADSAADG